MNSRVDSLLQEIDLIEERRRLRGLNRWSEEDNEKFITCIKSQFQSKEYLNENITDFIDWELLCHQMHRSFACCRRHWFKSIRIKLINEQNNNPINYWHQLYDNSRLISVIYDHNYDTEEDIDWDFLKEKFAKITNFNQLLRNWRNLKTTVPEWQRKTFKETIDWLYRHKTADEIVLSDDDYE